MDAQDHGAVPGLAAPRLAHHDHVDLAPLGTTAAHAVVTLTNEKAPDAANVGGPEQKQTRHLVFDQHVDDDKRFSTLRAQLALAGHALSRSDASDGKRAYDVSKWGMVRELRTLDDVQRFAEQVGVTHE